MSDAADIRYEDVTVGDTAAFEVFISEEMMQQFAELSGDYNPLHTNETYANETDFGGRVVYGMLGASFFSRLVGMHLPGKHAVYLAQSLLFRAPMRVGMQIVIEGEILQKVDALRVVTVRTTITEKGAEATLVEGEARVKLLA